MLSGAFKFSCLETTLVLSPDRKTGQFGFGMPQPLPHSPIRAAGPVWAVATVSDTIYSGTDTGALQVWERESGREVTGESHQITRRPTANTGRLRDEDIAQMKATAVGRQPSKVASADVSPDAVFIVLGLSDATIQVFNSISGEVKVLTLRGHTKCVQSVAISPHATQLVSGSDDKTVRVWDLSTGEEKKGDVLEQAGWRARARDDLLRENRVKEAPF